MKQMVKLNEAQLRKVVSESVQKVLNELDWKTYANAMRKANARGEYKRASTFGDAADSAFDDKYGYNPDAGYKEPTVRRGIGGEVVGVNDDGRELRRMYDYDSDTGTYTNPRNYDSTKAFGLLDKYDNAGRYKRYTNPSLKRFFNNPEQEKAYKKASEETDNYMLGKYSYDDENGWHLEESVLRKIVSESIQKVLGNIQ